MATRGQPDGLVMHTSVCPTDRSALNLCAGRSPGLPLKRSWRTFPTVTYVRPVATREGHRDLQLRGQPRIWPLEWVVRTVFPFASLRWTRATKKNQHDLSSATSLWLESIASRGGLTYQKRAMRMGDTRR